MSKKLPELRRTRRPDAETAEGTPSEAVEKPAPKRRTTTKRRKPATPKRAAPETTNTEAAASGDAARDDTPANINRGDDTVTAQAETIDNVENMEAETAAPSGANPLQRRHEANAIVAKYAAWSSAFGLVPVPIADVAGISATQVSMVVSLSRHYGVPFSKTWIRTILGAIVGGAAPWAITKGVVSTVFKSMPGVGLAVGIAGMAGLSNLATRTLGNLFIEHFEAGGNLENVNTDQMRQSFKEKMKQGATS